MLLAQTTSGTVPPLDPHRAGLACHFRPLDAGRDHAVPVPAGQWLLGQVNFGAHAGPPVLRDGAVHLDLHMAAPGLAPVAEQWTTDRPVRTGSYEGLRYAWDGEFLFCAGHLPESGHYRDSTRAAYQAVFELTERLGCTRVLRMWNFISGINQDNAEGLEVYRDFCLGRAEAFESHYAGTADMPAATGIGALGGGISFSLLACRDVTAATHVENSWQMPAYHYPQQYGPKSPSFARATHVRGGPGSRGALYVSGTAGILGHRTVHQGDIDAQCDVALDNIAHLISRENLRRHGVDEHYDLKELRFIKVYVRHREHLEQVRSKCAAAFPGHAEIAYFNVDVCRADLLVEIEGVVPG